MNNPLVTPEIGLLFWTIIVFLLLLLLLKKVAWKPIINAVNQRSEDIDKALEKAEEAKKEVESLKSKNTNLIKEAREERDKLLKEATQMKNQIIEQAKTSAKEEEERILNSARVSINREKLAAINELKAVSGKLAIDIAQQILKEELKDSEKQDRLVNSYLEKINLN